MPRLMTRVLCLVLVSKCWRKQRERSALLCGGKKSKAVWVELGISWPGEAMRSVIRMLWAVLEKRVPSDSHVWTLRVFWSAEAWTLLAPRSTFFLNTRGASEPTIASTQARRAAGDSRTHGELDFYFYCFLYLHERQIATMQRSFLRFAFPRRTFKLTDFKGLLLHVIYIASLHVFDGWCCARGRCLHASRHFFFFKKKALSLKSCFFFLFHDGIEKVSRI